MPNIKFNYLYRDSANYKTFGYVVLTNPDNIDIAELDALIRSRMIDEMFFYSYQWQLPKLFPDTFDPYIDPTWHEFESVDTHAPATEPLTAVQFAASVKGRNKVSSTVPACRDGSGYRPFGRLSAGPALKSLQAYERTARAAGNALQIFIFNLRNISPLIFLYTAQSNLLHL